MVRNCVCIFNENWHSKCRNVTGEGHPQEANYVVTRQIENLWWGQSTNEVLWPLVAIAQDAILVLPSLFVMWTHDQMAMWLHRWITLTLSYNPANFDDHRSCRGGDIMFLIWHVTSHDHMVKRLCDFSGAISLLEEEILCF